MGALTTRASERDESSAFAEDGFELMRGAVAPQLHATLREVLERVHTQWRGENEKRGREEDLVNSFGLTATRFFPPPFESQRVALFDALAGQPWVDRVQQLFGDAVFFHGTQLFFNPLRGDRQPYWHRDIQFAELEEHAQQELFAELGHLHVRIPLRPETRFLLVPGSHVRWDSRLEGDVRLERCGHTHDEDLPSARSFDLEPGDVLLFHAHMLHRGTYANNETRLSLDLMLATPHPDFPVRVDADALPTRAQLDEIREPRWYRNALANVE